MRAVQRICAALFAALAFTLTSSPAFSSDSFDQTALWWESVQKRTDRYNHELQALYRQIEASHPDRNNLNQAFCRELVTRHSGSICNPSTGIGVLSAPGNLSISFNFRWEISTVRQKNGALTMTYHIGGNTPGVYEIADGSNIIAVQVDSENPENSRFIRAVIPAFSATASDLWNRNPQKKNPAVSPLLGILTDAYTLSAHGDGPRMDQFAESFLTDLSFRNNAIEQVRLAYLGSGEPERSSLPQEPQAVAVGQSISPSQGNSLAQELPSIFLKGIVETFASLFRQSAWIIIPVFIFFILVSILKIKASKAATGYARRGAGKSIFWLIQELFALWMGKEESQLRFESQGYLLTEAERVFFEALEQAIEGKGYHVAMKPRLADIIRVPNRSGKNGFSAFLKISQKHLDFVVVEKSTSRIIGAIELDDRSHARQDRRERDRFVEEALEQAGIPLFRQPWQREYSVSSLSAALERTFNSQRDDEFSKENLPAWAAREWK